MSVFKLDKAHSGISFQVRHMMISRVKGEFKDFDVSAEGELDNLEGLNIKVEVDASSVNTNNEDRDGHLRSADFFEVEKYPTITVQSTAIRKTGDNVYELMADVTIKDKTISETFVVTYNGSSKNPMDGSTVAGFELEGTINREAYGLTWNAPLETGGVLVGKDIQVSAGLEFVIE